MTVTIVADSLISATCRSSVVGDAVVHHESAPAAAADRFGGREHEAVPEELQPGRRPDLGVGRELLAVRALQDGRHRRRQERGLGLALARALVALRGPWRGD